MGIFDRFKKEKGETGEEKKEKVRYELTGWRKVLFFFVLAVAFIVITNFVFFGFLRAGAADYLGFKFMDGMINTLAWLIPLLLGYLLALGIPTPISKQAIRKMWPWYIIPIVFACALVFLGYLFCPSIFRGGGRFLSLIWICAGFCCGLFGPKPFLDIELEKDRWHRMLVLKASKDKDIYTFKSWLDKPMRVHEDYVDVRSVWFYIAHYRTKTRMCRTDKGDYILLAPAKETSEKVISI